MTRHPSTFATRLAAAHALIARGIPRLPDHLADQLSAAAAETLQLHGRIAAVLPAIDPGGNWQQRMDHTPPEDVRAYLLAALADCRTVCPHLKNGGPQPAFVRLPLHRIDCSRCVQTLRRPPPDEADRCDCCGERGIVTFVPFCVKMGTALVAGDACPDCAAVLGIRQEAAS